MKLFDELGPQFEKSKSATQKPYIVTNCEIHIISLLFPFCFPNMLQLEAPRAMGAKGAWGRGIGQGQRQRQRQRQKRKTLAQPQGD